MAISRTQPMRPAEIDLLDHMDSAEGDIGQLQEDLEETNRAVGELNRELEREIDNRQIADTALGTRIDNETLARTQADEALGTRINDETLARTQADDALDNRLDTAENDIGILQRDFAAFPAFEYGASSDNEITAGSNEVIDIEFQEEKTNTPYILIGIECIESALSNASNCYGIIVAASNAGFSVRVYNLDTVNDETVTINWLAIGE